MNDHMFIPPPLNNYNIKFARLARQLAVLVLGLLLVAPQIGWAQNWQWVTANQATVNNFYPDNRCGAVTTDAAGNAYVAGHFEGTQIFVLPSGPTVLTSVGDSDAFIAKINATGQYQWVRQIASTGEAITTDIVTDAAGNLVIAGKFKGDITFGGTVLTGQATFQNDYTLFVAHYTVATQTWDWASQNTGPGTAETTGLGIDAAGNVYVGGTVRNGDIVFDADTVANTGNFFDSDAFIAKRTPGPLGIWQWALKPVGVSNDYLNDLTTSPQGDVYLTGVYSSAVLQFGNTTPLIGVGENMFVAKLNTNGIWQWARASDRQSTIGEGVAVDDAGDAYITGRCYTGGATVLFSSPGNTVSVTAGRGAMVAKISSGGDWRWVRLATDGSSTGKVIRLDATGNIFIAGGGTSYNGLPLNFGGVTLSSNSSSWDDVFVARLSPEGRWQWAADGGSAGGGDDDALGLSVSSTGRLFVMGHTTSGQNRFGALTPFTSTTENFFVAALDRAGAVGVASFNPAVSCGPLPLRITVTGSGFATGTGVLINGYPGGNVSVQSPTSLLVTVPPGTTSGPITVYNSAGIGFSVGNFIVGPNPAPTATFTYPSAMYCRNAANPTASITGTAGGTFSAPAGLILDAQTGTINLAASTPGTYAVTYAISGPCAVTSAPRSVTVTAVPSAPPAFNITLQGALRRLEVPMPIPGVTYQWFRGTTLVGTGTSFLVTSAAQSGSYTVVATQNGCQSAASPAQIITVVGLTDDLPGVSCDIYPNPTGTGFLTVALTGHTQPLGVALFDALGRAVLTARATAAESTLDMRALPHGVYLLRATNADGRGLSRRVVVE